MYKNSVRLYSRLYATGFIGSDRPSARAARGIKRRRRQRTATAGKRG
jgi:hypothetical protein